MSIANQKLRCGQRPYTGWIVLIHFPFQLERLAHYRDGLQDGKEILWHDNGARALERNFSMGVPDGRYRSWYANGHVKVFKNYDRGLADGEQWAWYDNGQVAEYNRYDHDREIVHKTWTFDGKPFHNYVYQNQKKIGLEGEEFCKKISKPQS